MAAHADSWGGAWGSAWGVSWGSLAGQDESFVPQGLLSPEELQKRGFEETLVAFALERRREREERELAQLFAVEAEMIMQALKPFIRED